ncbi:MAG: DUF6776 family protein [Gammaproteobacteria bacterium]|nr:DUF6776 family protein [Gammaproteobacteria bacterium]
MSRHRLVVRPHRPLRNGIVYTVVAVSIIALILGAFEFGRQRGGYDAMEASRLQGSLQREITTLNKLNRELRERIALLERSGEIDREAREQVQANLTAMQDEVLELREELAFYRGIVSPDDAQAGLRIQSFRLTPGPDAELFHYRLVLIQAIKHDRRASGEVEVTLHGVQDGQPTALPLASLVEGGGETLNYSFKYFQDFEGDIRLPAGFSPARVEINVRPNGRGGENIKQSLDWSQAVG